jgi:hypothetical protein
LALPKSDLQLQSQEAIEAHTENLQASGYQTDLYGALLNAPVSRTVHQFPRSIKDQRIEPELPYGKPDEWDYRNTVRGMRGEALPQGAVGWTPDGQPWYGTNNAVSEWFMGYRNKTTTNEVTSVEAREKRRVSYKSYLSSLLSGDVMGVLSGAVETTAAAFEELGAVGVEEEDIGEEAGGLARISKEVGQVIVGAGLGLGEAAEETERLVAGTAASLEEIGEEGFGERGASLLVSQFDPFNLLEREDFWGDVSRFSMQFGTKLHPLSFMWNAIRAVASPIPGEKKKDIFEKNFNAGRIIYSSFIDSTITEEFNRRMRAGESPYLLALELQNPVAELVGEAAFDPLNFLGAISKGRSVQKSISSAEDFFFTAAREFTPLADNLTDAQKGAQLVEQTQQLFKRIGTNLDEFASQKGLFSLTANSSRAYINNIAGDFLNQVSSFTGSDPDMVMDVVDAMVKMSSSNVDEVSQGLAILGSTPVPAEFFQSEGGARISIAVREMLSDADGVVDGKNFLGGLREAQKSGDPVDVMDFMNSRMDKATKRMFPTLAERVEAGDELTAIQRTFKTLEDVTDSRILRTVNAFYANVYMGFNPGYAFRNLISNWTHIMVDEGPGVFKHITPSRVLEELANTRGAVGAAAFKGFGGPAADLAKGGKIGGKFNMLNVSAKFERIDSARVYLKSFRDSVQKMLPGIFTKNEHILRNSGMADDVLGSLYAYAQSTRGNIDEALDLLRLDYADEVIDVMKTGEWVPDEALKFLDGFGMRNEFLDVLRNNFDDLDAISAGIDDIFADFNRKADELNHMLTQYPKGDDGMWQEGLLHHDYSVKTYNEFTTNDELSFAFNHSKISNKIADERGEMVLHEAVRLARSQGVDVDPILANNDVFMGIVRGEFWQAAKVENRLWVDKFVDVTRQVRGGKITPADGWRAISEMEGPPPAGMTEKQFLNYMWDGVFHPNSRRRWAAKRDGYSETVGQLVEQLRAAGLQTDEAFDVAEVNMLGALQDARNWDTGIVEMIGDGLVNNIALDPERYDEFGKITTLAKSNGIATLSPSGAQLENRGLLNIVNKHAGTQHKSIKDMRLHEVVTALENKLGDKFFNPFGRVDVPVTEVDIPLGLEDVFNVAADTQPDQLLDEMDSRVADSVKLWASDMQDRVSGAEPGQRIFLEPEVGGAPEVRGLGTSFPDWYGDIIKTSPYHKGNKGRRAVEEALQAIVDGVDENTALQKRLKEIALGEFENQPADFLTDLQKRVATFAPEPDDAGFFDEIMEGVDQEQLLAGVPEPELIPAPEGALPYEQFVYGAAQQRGDFDNWQDMLQRLATENHGKKRAVIGSEEITAALDEFGEIAGKDEFQMRSVANQVATEARNFALVDYENRTNMGTAVGMMFPYYKWYSGSFPAWGKRFVQNPALLANYQRYKDTLAQIHAGAPEWWKYNININEITKPILGIEVKNGMYINLEATLNPIYGLTGVDFDDPYKRVNWWTTALDGANRFGPSTHPLLSAATAYALYLDGEEEAAARWGGRLIPQTATFQAIDAAIGEDPIKEVDPFVNLFSGGTDPYLRKRVGRALSQMVLEGLNEEIAIDAAHAQSGEVWEAAKERAISARAPGQLTSYMLGVGFKARNQGDLMTDDMYDDYFSLLDQRGEMDGDDFRFAMDDVRRRYPFMDAVLISRKGGDERDSAFSYATLGRIPPGDTTRFYEMVGLERALVNMFYEDKGDFDTWAKSDKLRFMAAVTDLSAILAIPGDSTRQEWTQARVEYSDILDEMEKIFGEEIHDEIDTFYAFYNYGDERKAEEYLFFNPQVEDALDFKGQRIATDPTSMVATYYGGIDQIEKYYKGLMYNEAEARFGLDIFDVQAEYFDQPTRNAAKQYLRQNPKLKQYWDFRDQTNQLIIHQVIGLGSQLREGQDVEVREKLPEIISTGAKSILEGINQAGVPVEEFTPEDWQQTVGQTEYFIILEAAFSQRALDFDTKDRIDRIADEFGITRDRLMELVGVSFVQNQQPQLQ